MTVGLQLLQPITVTSAMLTSSNVPVPAVGDSPDPAVWLVGTSYAIAARVHVVSTQTIYESAIAANLGNDPTLAANAAKWLVVGSTNRWRMFDQRNSSQTTLASSVDVTVTPGVIYNACALLNVTGASSARVTMTDPSAGVVYDVTTSMQAPPSIGDYYEYFFEAIKTKNTLIVNLPSYRLAALRVLVSGTGVVGVGVLSIGAVQVIGMGVNYGAKVGIQDYSIKTKNAYGDYQITERAFNKRASFEMWVERGEVDALQTLLSSVRAKPCVWIGSGLYDSTIIYGFYKDFDIAIQYHDLSLFTLTLEGLT